MEIKKIILAGGNGFLGQCIIDRFKDTSVKIIVLSRGKVRQEKNVQYLKWDGITVGSWLNEIDEADVLINLTGKSVDCRYTEKNKKEIIRSRVDATNVLAEAINQLPHPPRVWMNAASATIYRYAEDRAMDELTGDIGSGFSVDVCKQWEAAFDKAIVPQTRKITLRISMVLGKEAGVLPVMKKLVNAGLGGKMGSGDQYMSWIHETDFVNCLLWLIDHEESGVFNIASPYPLSNNEFMKLMRKTLHRKFGLPAAKWMLEIGAVLLCTETELILKSRRVLPTKLLKSGFQFKYPEAEDALKNLLS